MARSAHARVLDSSGIVLPETAVAGFTFSAMTLNPAGPLLTCTIAGAPGVSATLDVTVMLFEEETSNYPAKVASGRVQIEAGLFQTSQIGQSAAAPPSIDPAKVEIQVVASNVSTSGLATITVTQQNTGKKRK